jgi:hypothetical protein
VATPPTPAQKLTVLLAFVLAAVNFSVLVFAIVRTGTIQALPLFGGLLMLTLGMVGYSRIRQPPG